jgi:hypothetical protein
LGLINQKRTQKRRDPNPFIGAAMNMSRVLPTNNESCRTARVRSQPQFELAFAMRVADDTELRGPRQDDLLTKTAWQ